MSKFQGAVPKNTNFLFVSARALDHSSDAAIVNFIIPQQTKEKAKSYTIFCKSSLVLLALLSQCHLFHFLMLLRRSVGPRKFSYPPQGLQMNS